MCIIIHGLKKNLVRSEIEESMRRNPSGFFFASIETNQSSIKEVSPIRTMNPEEILIQFDQTKPDAEILLHARIPSRGPTCIDNCHGWNQDGVYFCHNGTLSQMPEWKNKTDSETFFRKIFLPAWEYTGEFNEWLNTLVESFAQGNRFAFILPNGEVKLFGHYITDHDCSFSNSSYKVYKPTTVSAHTTSTRYPYDSWIYGRDYEYDYDDECGWDYDYSSGIYTRKDSKPAEQKAATNPAKAKSSTTMTLKTPTQKSTTPKANGSTATKPEAKQPAKSEVKQSAKPEAKQPAKSEKQPTTKVSYTLDDIIDDKSPVKLCDYVDYNTILCAAILRVGLFGMTQSIEFSEAPASWADPFPSSGNRVAKGNKRKHKLECLLSRLLPPGVDRKSADCWIKQLYNSLKLTSSYNFTLTKMPLELVEEQDDATFATTLNTIAKAYLKGLISSMPAYTIKTQTVTESFIISLIEDDMVNTSTALRILGIETWDFDNPADPLLSLSDAADITAVLLPDSAALIEYMEVCRQRHEGV